MKNTRIKFIVTALIILQSVVQIQAQSKNDLEKEVADKTATIDSLKLQVTDLEEKLESSDSMAVRLASLEVMYSATKDKILKEDFNPNDFAAIIDSNSLVQDSILKELTSDDNILLDSLKVLNQNNADLEKTIGNCIEMINLVSNSEEAITREDVEKGLDENRKDVIHQLKQLKELLDSGILTEEEFEIKKKKVLEKW